MAFPTYVGSGIGATYDSTTTLAVNPNGSHASGDYEVLVVETMSDDPDASLSTAAGFTQHPGSPVIAAGATLLGTQLGAFERIWNGSDGSPTVADAGNHVIAVIFTFRRSTGTWSALSDARSATVNIGWASSSETTEDTTGEFPDLSSAESQDFLLVGITCHAKPDIAGGTAEMSAITNGNLGSITERWDDAAAAGNGGWIGMFTGTRTGGGAPGTTTYTKATASYKTHLVIALRDSAPGGAAATYPGWEGGGWWFRNEEWAHRHGIPLLGEVPVLGEAA